MKTDENGRVYLNAASPKKELFNALKEQVARAEAAEAERDELRRQLEQAHAIIAEQSNTVMDLTL